MNMSVVQKRFIIEVERAHFKSGKQIYFYFCAQDFTWFSFLVFCFMKCLILNFFFEKGKNQWWNELVATGLFAVILGIFLIVLNCLISKREEDDLEEYVQRQLTRSKSGHRLERDVETGGLTTRHNRRIKSHAETAEDMSHSHSKSNITPVTSELVTPTTPNGKFTTVADNHE